MGSSPYRNYSLLAIAHPVLGPPFRYKVDTGERRSDEAVIVKKATYNLDKTFVKSILYKRIVIKFFWTIANIVGYVIMVRGS